MNLTHGIRAASSVNVPFAAGGRLGACRRHQQGLFFARQLAFRARMDFVSWKDRKPLVTALKGIYRAVDAEAAEAALTAFEASEWGQRDPAIGLAPRLDEVVPFFAFPDAVRRIIYTTNAIEALNSKLRRAVRARGGTSPATRPPPSSSF